MDAQLERQKELTRAVLAEIAIRDAAPVDAVLALASALGVCIQTAAVSREVRPFVARTVLAAVEQTLADMNAPPEPDRDGRDRIGRDQ
ncbi:hypothetical protein [Elioraea sp.]|uniref:hypothetical protein n=1 Tax=Elioraea sp. TaxID=2185103 RepID=UPI003F6EBEB0